jgi:hypothetical protein
MAGFEKKERSSSFSAHEDWTRLFGLAIFPFFVFDFIFE